MSNCIHNNKTDVRTFNLNILQTFFHMLGNLKFILYGLILKLHQRVIFIKKNYRCEIIVLRDKIY